MWKVTGRSSVLDRAQALLSAKRSRRGGDPPTAAQGGSFKPSSDPPNIKTLMSDLSDLSMESSASAAKDADAQEDPERRGGPTEDVGPQSSLGEGSRFLKKAPRPASSSQSPVSRNRVQPPVEPRRASSPQRGSQASAWRRLADIESRVRSRQQALQLAKRAARSLTSDLEPPAAKSDSEQSSEENRFLKKRTGGAAAERGAAQPAGVGVGSRSAGGSPDVRSGGLERKLWREGGAVSLESDEEDMKELLGDSVSRPASGGRPYRTDLSRRGRRPAAARPMSPSNTAPPRSPASPSCRRSPFRFTGQARIQFSPSALSPRTPSPPERPGSSQRAGSLQRSHSSPPSRAEVLSLEELFPVGPESDHQHCLMSSVSEGFRINVKTLDELIPVAAAGKLEKQNRSKLVDPVPGSQEEEEVVPDYQSDFDFGSSTGEISEHLDDEDAEVRKQVSATEKSANNPGGDYSSTVSEPSRSSGSWTPGRSWRSGSFSGSSRRSAQRSTGRSCRDAAVQTQPHPAGVAPVDPTVSRMYLKPTPAVSAERLEAISMFDPAIFALNETLKQQLAMTRRSVELADQLHAALLRSLEQPDYRYTTLEETVHKIREHRHRHRTGANMDSRK